jgi:NTE family protein
VFGGGGAFGIGFIMGTVQAFADQGVHLERGRMLGTSAGSWSAAALATGASFEDMVQCWERHADLPRPIRASVLTTDMFGNARDGRVSTIALRLQTGRRHVLCGAEYPLADVVAASSSVPHFSSPHVIDGRRYIDGGVLRITSADRAPSADLLVVVSPVARGVLGGFGALAERTARMEITRWKLRTGGQVLFVRPDREVARYAGKGPNDLLDMSCARPTYKAAYDMATQVAEAFLDRNPRAAIVAA